MEILLEEFYKTDLHVDKYHDRKIFIDENSYQINGISKSGKTHLLKHYLLGLRKSSYLYVDCQDIRINIAEFNKTIKQFCNKNKIDTLVFDNYTPNFEFANVSQLLIASQTHYEIEYLQNITLFPLDYEEFLAYEHKFDSSALNHFFQLGGLPVMHKISQDERSVYLQTLLRNTLNEIEFEIMLFCARASSLKISAFTIYERLKTQRKISKDKLYAAFKNLESKNYLYLLKKYNHTRATKKIYLCDTSFKSALSIEKNFSKLFENMIFLELVKSNTECYYEDGIDFYLPKSDEIILCKPFADERRLFKKLEDIEAFIFTHSIKKITAISMNKEGSLSHPLASVDIIPFDIWALGDLDE